MLIGQYKNHRLHIYTFTDDYDREFYEFECEMPDNTFISIDYDQNTKITGHIFKLWVDIGLPLRYDLNIIDRPLSSDDILRRWDELFAKPITM